MMLFTTTILLIATTLSTLALGIYSSTLVGTGTYVTSELVLNYGASSYLHEPKRRNKQKEQKARASIIIAPIPTIIRQLEKNNADSNERSATISRHHGGRRRRR